MVKRRWSHHRDLDSGDSPRVPMAAKTSLTLWKLALWDRSGEWKAVGHQGPPQEIYFRVSLTCTSTSGVCVCVAFLAVSRHWLALPTYEYFPVEREESREATWPPELIAFRTNFAYLQSFRGQSTRQQSLACSLPFTLHRSTSVYLFSVRSSCVRGTRKNERKMAPAGIRSYEFLSFVVVSRTWNTLLKNVTFIFVNLIRVENCR